MKENVQYNILHYFIKQIIMTFRKNNTPSAPTKKSKQNEVSGIINGDAKQSAVVDDIGDLRVWSSRI